MSYKTVLVYVDESRRLDTRVAIAAKIAMNEGAHLIGMASTGVSRFMHETISVSVEDPAIAAYLELLRQRAERGLESFKTVAGRTGAASLEIRLTDDEAARGVGLQALSCDLAVLGQDDPDERSPVISPGFAEYVIMSGGCPALVIPYAGTFDTVGDRALIAWNASVQAAHAVRGAMPLLKRSGTVKVAVFNPSLRPEVFGEQPGADIAAHLARHGIKAEVMKEEVGDEANVGSALLSLVSDLGSDLLVMGCYGHSRFREILLGGVTRTILQSMTVPALLAH